MKREQRKRLTRTYLKALTLSPSVVVRKVGCRADKVTCPCEAEAYRGEDHR